MKLRRYAWLTPFLLVILTAGVALAAAEGHGEEASPWDTWTIMWRIINAVALLALLTYFLKQPLTNFFSNRRSQIEKDLEDAKAQREQAERTIKDYEEKIAGMEQELEKMRAELRKSAELESSKVVDNAGRMAAAMVESAKLTADQEVRKARTSLQNEAVEMAVRMAEAIIREKISDDDHQRLVDEYLDKVEGMK